MDDKLERDAFPGVHANLQESNDLDRPFSNFKQFAGRAPIRIDSDAQLRGKDATGGELESSGIWVRHTARQMVNHSGYVFTWVHLWGVAGYGVV